jgi:ubiquinone biosynthesis protein COQ9
MEEMSIACSDSEKYYEFDNELRLHNEIKNNEMAAETKRNKMKYMNVRKYVKQSAAPVAPFEGTNNDTVVTSSNVLTSEQIFPLIVPNTLIQSDDIKELLQEQQPVPIFQRNKQFAAKFRSDIKMPTSLNQAVAAQASGPQEGSKRFVFQADV